MNYCAIFTSGYLNARLHLYKVSQLTLCIYVLLQIATLGLLDSLTTKYAHGGLDGEGMQKILAETPALVTELDLQISQLALNFVAGGFFLLFRLLVRK